MASADPMDWPRYFASTRDKPLHPLYRQLDPLLPPHGLALELGCGHGHGVLHLLDRGLRVIAVDLREEPLQELRSRLPAEAEVRIIQDDITHVDLPENDLSVLGFALFFLSPDQLHEFWPRLVASIKPGGLFMGQFLGVNDDWASWGYTTHSCEEVLSLLSPFELLHFEEVERDGATSWEEPKHWHIFHVIGRKE